MYVLKIFGFFFWQFAILHGVICMVTVNASSYIGVMSTFLFTVLTVAETVKTSYHICVIYIMLLKDNGKIMENVQHW